MNALSGNFSGFLFSAAYSLTNILSSPYNAWFPIVALAAIMVILIAIVIGMMAPLLGRNNLVLWARIKAYEEIATVMLAIIFLAFSSFLGALNPVPALSSVGLVPPSCSGSATLPINNLWGLAVCNMNTFNQNFITVMTVAYWVNFVGNLGPDIGIAPNLGGIGAKIKGSLSTGPNSLFLTPLFNIILIETMISMLQVLLLSSSPLLFSFLIGIGLIARSFGITRTFGNAMIALGIGIGLIYPLLVVVTYGFINTTYSNILSAVSTSLTYLMNNEVAYIFSLFQPLFISTTPLSLSFAAGVGAQIWNIIALLVLLGSVVGIGLVFIPILNFMILNAFVIDFSSALGQQVSFMELLTKVI